MAHHEPIEVYAVSYLTIQSSHIDNDVLLMVEHLTKRLAESDNTVKDYFLFADTALTFKTWLYFVCEHLVLIMLAYVIAYEAKEYKITCKVFFWIQVADLADYLLTYNTNWVGFINFNIVAVLIFATSIFYEYVRVND